VWNDNLSPKNRKETVKRGALVRGAFRETAIHEWGHWRCLQEQKGKKGMAHQQEGKYLYLPQGRTRGEKRVPLPVHDSEASGEAKLSDKGDQGMDAYQVKRKRGKDGKKNRSVYPYQKKKEKTIKGTHPKGVNVREISNGGPLPPRKPMEGKRHVGDWET